MKQQLPPNNREDIEAQVTALLLGELTDEQAAAVRARIAEDKEVAKWHDTLKQTLPLVRETVATPANEIAAQPAPLKLSEARRQKLLAQFKTVKSIEFSSPRRSRASWPLAIAAAAAVALLAASYVPYLGTARKMSTLSTRSIDAEAARKASSPNATFYADQDSSTLFVIGDNETSQAMSDVVKGLPPASTSASAKTPIVLPAGNGDNYAAANLDAAGRLADGAATSSARSLFQNNLGGARRSRGRAGRGIQSVEKPATELSSVPRQPIEPVQTAERGTALAPAPAVPAIAPLASADNKAGGEAEITSRGSMNSQSSQLARQDGETLTTGTIPAVGTVSGTMTLAPGASPQAAIVAGGAIDAQGGTVPPVQIARVGGFGAQEGFVPQAKSSAGSTLGVPVAGVSTRQQGTAPIPGNASTSESLFDIAGASSVQTAAPVQLARAAGQDEYKKSPEANGQTEKLDRLSEVDAALPRGPIEAPIPQPEVQTLSNALSTFSLNVSDVAFKLAAASLENGVMPDASTVRSEEFINAFDYRDPQPAPGAPIGFAWDRANDPFAHNRDFLRFSVKTAAQGRDAGRPLNLVLLLDKSGSMERADRVEIIRQALTVLARQLQERDTLSVVTFARTPHLWVDGVSGKQAGEIAKKLTDITPEGGTNLEEAMRLAYATALRHYLSAGENRVVLLTDGAANLGEVDPGVFKPWIESNRKQGIALDCFGIGWDGYNDATLESLSRTGGGRYGFINTPEEAAADFAGQLAGALRVAASDVKVQVEFNPNRVVSYRQIGYAKHQLTAEQFRDNTVAAAQIGAAESGNALYTIEVNPAGDGPLCTVRVRYRDPGTTDYHERAWDVPYTSAATPLDKAAPAMRLAASAGAFSELLGGSPFAGEVTFDRLLNYLNGIPAVYGADTRPQKLEWMVRQAKSISGK